MNNNFAKTGRWLTTGGLTLIELVITIVLLSIALVAITNMLYGGLGRSSDTLLELRTAALGQSYLDEILGKKFDENSANGGVPPCRAGGPTAQQCSVEVACPLVAGTPTNPPEFGPDGMEEREDYDDVDDYHCLQEGADYGSDLEDSTGTARTGYDNYSVSIEVRYINLGSAEEEENLSSGAELDDQYDAKVITVTIGHAQLNSDFVYSAYKANF